MPTSHDHDCPEGCAGRPGLSRRHALAGVAASGLGVSFLAACGGSEDAGSSSDGNGSGGDSGGGGGDGGGQAGPLAATADVPEGGGVIIEDQGVVVTQPAAGEFKAFSSTCTHQGCAVNEIAGTINCPCHGSQFSLEDGSAVQGPATEPLESIPITVEGDQVVLG